MELLPCEEEEPNGLGRQARELFLFFLLHLVVVLR